MLNPKDISTFRLFFVFFALNNILQRIFPFNFLSVLAQSSEVDSWVNIVHGTELVSDRYNAYGYFISKSLSSENYLFAGIENNRPFFSDIASVDGQILFPQELSPNQSTLVIRSIRSIRETSDGGRIIAGWGCEWVSESSCPSEPLVAKLKNQTTIEWVKMLNFCESCGSANNYAYDVVETEDHGFLAVGYGSVGAASFSNYLGFIFKLDSQGHFISDTLFRSEFNPYTIYSVTPTEDGGGVAGGDAWDGALLAKVNATVDFDWGVVVKNMGMNSIQCISKDWCIGVGYTSENNPDNFLDVPIVTFNSTRGDLFSYRKLGGVGSDYGSAVSTFDGESCYLTGYIGSHYVSEVSGICGLPSNDSTVGLLIAKIPCESSNEHQGAYWVRSLVNPDHYYAGLSVVATSEGCTVTGQVQDINQDIDGYQIVTAKFTAEGEIDCDLPNGMILQNCTNVITLTSQPLPDTYSLTGPIPTPSPTPLYDLSTPRPTQDPHRADIIAVTVRDITNSIFLSPANLTVDASCSSSFHSTPSPTPNPTVNPTIYPTVGSSSAPTPASTSVPTPTPENNCVFFSPIVSPKVVNIPFLITLIGCQDDLSISFNSARGEVSPLYTEMKNSIWIGNITVYSIGGDNYLQLLWYGANYTSGYSTSNPFEVVDEHHEIPNNATLIGSVTDDDARPVRDATVQLYYKNPEINGAYPNASTITDHEGNYRFEHILPEEVFVKIEKVGYQDRIQSIETAEDRTVTGNAELYSDGVTEGVDEGSTVPILLVPGIMGSGSGGIVYPRLPFFPPLWNSGELKLHDPSETVGWKNLKDELKKRGYKEGRTLFDVAYDWSLPIETIRDWYFIPWLNKAKQKANRNQVDVVVHSMGGLVVRSYIQSEKYQNDIRKFAMVGTPNEGSNKIYYIWEGGDPITADELGENEGPFALKGQYFYTNTVYYLAEIRSHKKVCSFEANGYTPKKPCHTKTIYKFLRESMGGYSVGQLMPIYSNALLNRESQPVPIIHEENTFLKALNNQPCQNPKGCVDFQGGLYIFNSPESVLTSDKSDASKVLTKLFVGTEQRTISSIYIDSQLSDYTGMLYQDGYPRSYTIADGDQTVLAASVLFDDQLSYMKKGAEHSELINKFKIHIVYFILGINQYPYLNAEILEPMFSQLAMSIDGRVRPSIFGHYNQSMVQTTLRLDYSELTMNYPESGEYLVRLDSPYHEDYEISIAYFYGNNTVVSRTVVGFYDETLTTFNLTLNRNSTDDPLQFDRSFDTPVNLFLQNTTDGAVVLIWQDPVGDELQDVAAYDLYWRPNNELWLRFLAKTVQQNYTTDHISSEAIDNTYVVRSLLTSNRSTFFSPSASVNASSDEPVVIDDQKHSNDNIKILLLAVFSGMAVISMGVLFIKPLYQRFFSQSDRYKYLDGDDKLSEKAITF